MNKKTVIIASLVIALIVALICWKRATNSVEDNTEAPAVTQESGNSEPEPADDTAADKDDTGAPSEAAGEEDVDQIDSVDSPDGDVADEDDPNQETDSVGSVSVTDGGEIEITVPDEMGQGGF